jgi:OPA family glycerol-3-phosphate transporter-like MFS transporter
MDRRKQLTAFGLSWLAYATYYLGRRGFGVVKKPLHDQLGVSEVALGRIDTAYLTAYSLGQFVSGVLGDHVGARRLVGYGMLLSAAMCAAFGSLDGALAFGMVFAVNGLAQATGWPGTTRAMADWTTPETRGGVMAFFSTCYQVGGFAAVWFAGALASAYGWRAAFTGPAVVIALVAVAILLFLPAAPPTTPAPDLAAAGAPATNTTAAPATNMTERREAQRAVVRNPMIWLFAASYFFIKIIRYVLLFWLPYYLSTTLGYSTLEAAGISTAFDAGGLAGVVAIGLLSDRFRFGRAGLACVWLFGLVLACGAYVLWGASGKLTNVALLLLIGAMLFGPDSILCGAAAMDAGGPRAASMATGFVNGIGSIGPILQGLLVPPLAKHYGWQALFPTLVGLALCAALVLVPTFFRSSRRQ